MSKLWRDDRRASFIRLAGFEALVESFFLFLDFSLAFSSSESSLSASPSLPLLFVSESYLGQPQPFHNHTSSTTRGTLAVPHSTPLLPTHVVALGTKKGDCEHDILQ